MKDLTTENKVIGTILLDPKLYLEAVEIIDSDSFAEPNNAYIFSAIDYLFSEGQDVTELTVSDQIKKKTGKEVDVFNWLQYGEGETGFHNHCIILKEKQLARMQQRLAVELSQKASDPKQDPLETNEYLLSEAEKISTVTTLSKPKTNSELITSVTNKMDAASKSKGITGLRTGFTELDRTYGGRQRTDLIIKAGRPAMGKTSLALCEAKFMAYETGANVAFFSLEMGAEQLMQRLVSVHTGISLSSIRSGNLTKEQFSHYFSTVDYLRKDNLIIIDDVYSLSGIKTTARKLKMRGKLDAIYIDYLQLIRGESRSENGQQEITMISQGLKALAKELDVPVIAVSQLSRAVENRAEHRPQLSDLRESGSLEQDADVVVLLLREEYYNPTPENEGIAEVIIAKQRNGPVGSVSLAFVKKCMKFANLADSGRFRE